MPNALKSLPQLFADDTCILLHHLDLASLQNLLNLEIAQLYEWLKLRTILFKF